MKVGVIVLHYTGLDIVENLRWAKETGFDNCQLVSWDMSLWTDEEAAKINKAVSEIGIEIQSFWCGWEGPKVWDFYDGQETLGIVPVAFRHARFKNLCDGADFAKKIGVTDIITHAGYLPENPYDKEYNAIVMILKQIAAHYKLNGQNILFETGQETPVTLLRVLEDMDVDNAFINLDPANLIMYGKGNPVDAMDVFGKYVRAVHGKDGVYPTNGRNLGKETAIGKGKTNYKELVKRLKEHGFNGYITIEREIARGKEQTHDILNAKRLLEEYINS